MVALINLPNCAGWGWDPKGAFLTGAISSPSITFAFDFPGILGNFDLKANLLFWNQFQTYTKISSPGMINASKMKRNKMHTRPK